MNLIPKIAEMLGVEIGEEFKLRWNGVEQTGIFRFTNYRLESKFRDKENWDECSILAKLLNGGFTIVKIPFEPKDGEMYWTVYWKEIVDMPCAVYETWRGDSVDFANKVSGNCFRTEAEAKAHKFDIFEKLTGKKWEE